MIDNSFIVREVNMGARDSKSIKVSRLVKGLALGEEIREEEPKGKYPKGRIKQVLDIFGAEMNGLMRINLWVLVFALPLMFILFWYTNYVTSQAISGFNFMGNIGMGYPGGSDDAVQGLVAVYRAFRNVFYLVVPAMLILSIGLSGAFNCYKKAMWGENISKVTKVFFRGVKKYWWKYLAVMCVNALIILALGMMFLSFLEWRALGTCTAGHWVMVVFVSIIACLILSVNMMLLPLICELNVSFGNQIKNSIILSIKFAYIGIPLFLVGLLPLCLFFIGSGLLSVMLGIIVLMFGLILYGLSWTAYSQNALEKLVTPLYLMTIAPKNKKNKKGKKGGAANAKEGENVNNKLQVAQPAPAVKKPKITKPDGENLSVNIDDIISPVNTEGGKK